MASKPFTSGPRPATTALMAKPFLLGFTMTPFYEGAIVGWIIGALTPIVGCALADWLYQRHLRKNAKKLTKTQGFEGA